MRLIISPDYEQCSQWAADYVAYKIKAARPTENKPFVMAIPAGSSPLGMFERLIGMFRKGRLSFQNVVIFNMDEYVGLSRRRTELPQLPVEKLFRPYRRKKKQRSSFERTDDGLCQRMHVL